MGVETNRKLTIEYLEEKAIDCDGAVIRVLYNNNEPDYDTADHYKTRAKILRLASRILRGKVVILTDINIPEQPKD